jgi:hypothetical protein
MASNLTRRSLERRLVGLLRDSFEEGRNGGGARVAPREWRRAVRLSRPSRRQFIDDAMLLEHAKHVARSRT